MIRFLLPLLLCFFLASPVQAAEHRHASPQEQWRAMTAEERRAVIESWLALDETTRPPFPVYRDQQLDVANRLKEKLERHAAGSLTKN